jgi:hypothetical protein
VNNKRSVAVDKWETTKIKRFLSFQLSNEGVEENRKQRERGEC